MGTNEQPSAAPTAAPFALPRSSEPENRCCQGCDSPHPKSGISKTGRTDHPANNPSLPAACGEQGLPELIRLETSLSQWHGCRGNSLMLHHRGCVVLVFFLAALDQCHRPARPRRGQASRRGSPGACGACRQQASLSPRSRVPELVI